MIIGEILGNENLIAEAGKKQNLHLPYCPCLETTYESQVHIVQAEIKRYEKLIRDYDLSYDSLLRNEKSTLEELLANKQQVIEQTKNFLQLIDTNCTEAKFAIKREKLFFYRGLKNTTFVGFKGRSPVERKPLDSSYKIQSIYDELAIKLGMKAVRGNSIFVTRYKSMAEYYGKVYLVFPIDGKFDFTWGAKSDVILNDMDFNKEIYNKGDSKREKINY